MAKKSTKKVVKAAPVAKPAAGASGSGKRPKKELPEITWKATPEAKAEAKKLRIFSWVVWALAIGGEAFAIFWVLPRVDTKMWLLITLLVVIGLLAVAGSLMWKKANRLDPASERDKVKFFVQNQLGAIVTIIAFLPLIILIFMNKDMDGKQKGIAGGIGIAVLLVAGYFGATWGEAPSQENYSNDARIVMELTGKDEVFWTQSGSVYHLCAEVSDLQRESKTNEIIRGTIEQAQAAGKSRLTKKVETEINQCGLDINNYNPNPPAGGDTGNTDEPEEDADVTPDEEEATE